MQNKEVYEVSRDEFAGFVKQLAPNSYRIVEQANTKQFYSNKTEKELCEMILNEDSNIQYYVYNMPDNDERIAAKPVQKFVLKTKEEVQEFMNILNKLQEKKKND